VCGASRRRLGKHFSPASVPTLVPLVTAHFKTVIRQETILAALRAMSDVNTNVLSSPPVSPKTCTMSFHRIILHFKDIRTTEPSSIKLTLGASETWFHRPFLTGDFKQRWIELHECPLDSSFFGVTLNTLPASKGFA